KTFANMSRTPLVFPACNADYIETTDDVIRETAMNDSELSPELILQETKRKIEQQREQDEA
ncbi:hypothetical protein N9B50_01405, partial [bacterium]|nr:hypothetical protein [bacterium]